MREEGDSEYDSEKGNVIYAEIGEVFPDARGRFGEVIWAGEGGAI